MSLDEIKVEVSEVVPEVVDLGIQDNPTEEITPLSEKSQTNKSNWLVLGSIRRQVLAAASVIRPEGTICNVIATVAGGAVTVTSDPSISPGDNGQVLILRGSSATDTITLTDGNGMLMAGNITLGLDDTITFYYDGLVNNKWVEIARNLNTVQTYTPTNVTTDRAYDADTVVIAELADVVGTLIADLQKWGIIK
ncbi:MAG: hypothetical protein AAB922_06105 [Patescibacteria group bacterium]